MTYGLICTKCQNRVGLPYFKGEKLAEDPKKQGPENFRTFDGCIVATRIQSILAVTVS